MCEILRFLVVLPHEFPFFVFMLTHLLITQKYQHLSTTFDGLDSSSAELTWIFKFHYVALLPYWFYQISISSSQAELKAVEHLNPSQPNPGLRADQSSFILLSKKNNLVC